MSSLLVPVDGSSAALRALREAVRLASRIPGSTLHLVHVHEPPRLPEGIAAHVPGAEVEALLRRDAEAVLDRAEGEVQDSGVRYTRAVLSGPVAQTIAAHAERIGCDALVMGRHGITGEGDLPAGSVALKVLRASALPVILVR